MATTVEAVGLAKRFGTVRAVDGLTFTLQPGLVTGFLGPNGSGKSTTMRLMLGLDRGEGTTRFDGRALADLPSTTRVVGAHLDARLYHPTRTARDHLRLLATEARVSDTRVDEVLAMVGLASVARKRPKGFSLGMSQRLGLAGAILADPDVLLLDEPANGLDPQSIQWLRDFLRHYAARGKTVFVSSHLLSEMAQLADHLVVVARGTKLADESLRSFVGRSTRNDVLVRCTDPVRLADALRADGVQASAEGSDGLAVATEDTDRVGRAAYAAGIAVLELRARTASLEQAFLELTGATQQFATGVEPPA